MIAETKTRLTGKIEKSGRKIPARDIGNLLEAVMKLRTAVRQRIN